MKRIIILLSLFLLVSCSKNEVIIDNNNTQNVDDTKIEVEEPVKETTNKVEVTNNNILIGLKRNTGDGVFYRTLWVSLGENPFYKILDEYVVYNYYDNFYMLFLNRYEDIAYYDSNDSMNQIKYMHVINEIRRENLGDFTEFKNYEMDSDTYSVIKKDDEIIYIYDDLVFLKRNKELIEKNGKELRDYTIEAYSLNDLNLKNNKLSTFLLIDEDNDSLQELYSKISLINDKEYEPEYVDDVLIRQDSEIANTGFINYKRDKGSLNPYVNIDLISNDIASNTYHRHVKASVELDAKTKIYNPELNIDLEYDDYFISSEGKIAGVINGRSLDFYNTENKTILFSVPIKSNEKIISLSDSDEDFDKWQLELGKYFYDEMEFYILPDSDNRIYSQEEISVLNADELYIARNEIYARHGFVFEREELKTYFNSQVWYKENPLYDGGLTNIERENITILGMAEEKFNSKNKYVDLNNDGIKDVINYETLGSTYVIKVNDISYSGYGIDIDKNIDIVDINPNDSFKEIFIYDYGSENENKIYVLHYDGTNIIYAGEILGWGTVSEGYYESYMKSPFLQTWYYKTKYYLDNEGKITMLEEEFYDVYSVLRVMTDIYIQKDRDTKEKLLLKEDEMIKILSIDNKNWCKIENENGEVGWMYIDDLGYGFIRGTNLYPREVFEGLNFSD